jgi:hypothetical protein
MTLRIVGFSGSLNCPSKTRALVDLVTARAAAALGAVAATYDLTDLQPGLGAATVLEDLDAPTRASVAAILSADALVVGSPVYKGKGLGFQVMNAQYNFQIPQMFAAILLLAILGLTANYVLVMMQRSLCRWAVIAH